MSDYRPYNGPVKMGAGGLLAGILLGVLFPPFTWIAAYFLHKKFISEEDFSNAKGIKTGTLAAGITSVVLCLLFFSLSVLAAILVPNMARARAQGQLAACRNNEKTIAADLDLWAADHKGIYPKQLSELTGGENGRYLQKIPACPAAGKDTYSASYKRSPDGKRFVICCSGHNHGDIINIPPDKPAFDSEKGLIEK